MDILTATRSGFVRPGSGAIVGQDARDALLATRTIFGPSSDPVAFAKQLDAAVDALFEDIKKDRCVPSLPQCMTWWPATGGNGPHKSPLEFLNSYTAWMQSWRRYYNEHVNITFPDAQQNDVNSWYLQFESYRTQFKNYGGHLTTPNLPSPAEANKINPPPGGPDWTLLTYLGIGVVALLLLREVRPEREVVTTRLGAPPRPRTPPGPSLGERYRGAREGWREPRRLTGGSSSGTPRRLTSGRRNDVIDAEFIED